jgi:hypothetical protein
MFQQQTKISSLQPLYQSLRAGTLRSQTARGIFPSNVSLNRSMRRKYSADHVTRSLNFFQDMYFTISWPASACSTCRMGYTARGNVVIQCSFDP